MKTTLGFLLVFFLISALSWGLYSSGYLHGNISATDLANILGLMIASFSFVIGCYFAFIAVTAYSHIRDIERIAAETKQLHTSAQEHVKEIGTITDTIERQGRGFLKYIEESGTLIAEFLASVGKEQAKDFAEQAHLLRQRHAFTGGVDDKQKMDAARELVLLGDKVDWAAVEPFLVSSRHPDARELLQHIRKRRDAGDSA